MTAMLYCQIEKKFPSVNCVYYN